MRIIKISLTLVLVSSFLIVLGQDRKSLIIIENGKIEQAGSGFAFTEGPAVDNNGRIYFTDQPNDKIYVWDENEGVSLWLEGTGRSNGMYFTSGNQLVTCADEKNQLAVFDKDKNLKTLIDSYGSDPVEVIILQIHTIIAIGGTRVIKKSKMYEEFFSYRLKVYLVV